ncbi:3-oxoacyl-ACP reductase FabG [Pseudoalteromonas sp. OOF1S-7]|uniref:3-oxoacyl-ACP reductase FabG n=1 Tax=Pseudoalteromonas sp. OOF1S-7 TaxID=2917757 RepID=UPI001EF590EB|nr:3-oxoacyl-ACP reductase FabG [Pseudoalteromonas sp. OOF1S-7]MCG7534482.1 3-oxoacyl-ACP reductase FabG [Pseudoalteromonas sp. OOF1S-7]
MKTPWVLVTGGSRGIGKGLVKAFCQQGYEVVFTYLNSSEPACKLQEELEVAGHSARGYRCNGTDEQQVNAFAAKLIAEKGAPATIINNAGITRDGLLMSMPSSDWLDVINANLNGSFFMVRAFVNCMIEAGEGVIINMSSVSGSHASAGQCNYSATKAGLEGMTRSLAAELSRFGIRVNAIAPGYINTEMLDSIPDTEKKSIRRKIPLRRLGEIDDVAELALFLASSKASYITGQSFTVDGGLTI